LISSLRVVCARNDYTCLEEDDGDNIMLNAWFLCINTWLDGMINWP